MGSGPRGMSVQQGSMVGPGAGPLAVSTQLSLIPYLVMIYNFTRVGAEPHPRPRPVSHLPHPPDCEESSSGGQASLCSSPGPCLEATGRRVGKGWWFKGRLPIQRGRQQAALVPVCLGDFPKPELSAQGELGRPWDSGGPWRAGR